MGRKIKMEFSLHAIIVGTVAVAFIFITALSFFAYRFSMEGFLSAHENDNIRSNTLLSESVLNSSVNYLPAATRDWSSWDNTYDFVQGKYDEFLDESLTEYPFQLFRLNFVTVLNRDGDMIYERFYDFEKSEFMKLHPDLTGFYDRVNTATLASFNEDEELNLVNTTQIGVMGYVDYGGQIFYFSSYPIIHSDETGPAVGTFIFGRVVDETEIAFLTKNSGLPFVVSGIDRLGLSEGQKEELIRDKELVVKLDDTITGYKVFADMFGENKIVVSFTGSRELYNQGSGFINLVLFCSAGYNILILIVILVLLNRNVTTPLSKLVLEVDGISMDSDHVKLVYKSSTREVGKLTDAMNRMLCRIKDDRDIINENNKELYFRANYDMLTGLRNRFSIASLLDEYIDGVQNDNNKFVLFYFDLDRFKYINDNFGHKTGDALIVELARKLTECFEGTADLARMGGDEFIVVVKGLTGLTERERYVDKILSLFETPFHVLQRELLVTASIGSVEYPLDGNNMEALIKNAEIALYSAKEETEVRHVAYRKDLHAAMERKIYLESQMRGSIVDGFRDFSAYFQPKLDIKSGQFLSCEALMRWNPSGEFISPIEFIPLAEESGLIVPLSWWMMGECCRVGKMMEENGTPCNIAINMSTQVLLHDQFLPNLTNTACETGLSVKRLDIEIIESTLIMDVERVNAILDELHALGAEVSVDDFGTGYSSLSYLNKMRVDRIKIDKSFISKLSGSDTYGTQHNDSALVKTILAMGKNLGMVVTAEGVEDEGQLEFLTKFGCDEIQGYLLSKPLPEDEFVSFMLKKSTPGV